MKSKNLITYFNSREFENIEEKLTSLSSDIKPCYISAFNNFRENLLNTIK